MMPSKEKNENFMRQFGRKTNGDLSTLSASQLLAIWEHYDADGNGYIEKEELDNFLFEFVTSVCRHDVTAKVMTPSMLEELKMDFLDAYDENGDQRIEIKELAQVLPVDENFLLLFQLENRVTSSVDFMKLWNYYDNDHSGFIEGDELKDFMRNLVMLAHPDMPTLSDEKLDDYCKCVLRIFDKNNDGKLSLTEMSQLMPTKENVLKATMADSIVKGSERKLDLSDIDRIFKSYDKDGSGSIEAEELAGFAKDMLTLMKAQCSMSDIKQFGDLILASCDNNGDGKIEKDELTMMLMSIQKFIEA